MDQSRWPRVAPFVRYTIKRTYNALESGHFTSTSSRNQICWYFVLERPTSFCRFSETGKMEYEYSAKQE
eukprot:5143521-Pleurochrysis_carterae.AAC.2